MNVEPSLPQPSLHAIRDLLVLEVEAEVSPVATHVAEQLGFVLQAVELSFEENASVLRPEEQVLVVGDLVELSVFDKFQQFVGVKFALVGGGFVVQLVRL